MSMEQSIINQVKAIYVTMQEVAKHHSEFVPQTLTSIIRSEMWIDN